MTCDEVEELVRRGRITANEAGEVLAHSQDCTLCMLVVAMWEIFHRVRRESDGEETRH